MRTEYNSFINNNQDYPDYLNLLKIRSISHIMLLYYGDNINSLFKQYTFINQFLFNNLENDKDIKTILLIKTKRCNYNDKDKYISIFDCKFLIKVILVKDILENTNSLNICI